MEFSHRKMFLIAFILISYASTSNGDNGKFVKYTLEIPNRGRSMFAQAIDGAWKRQLSDVSINYFADCDRRIVFKNKGDSLGILELGTDSIQYVPQAAGFVLPEEGERNFVAYTKKDSSQNLVLLNLVTGETKEYAGVESYFFSKHGMKLVMLMNSTQDNSAMREVIYLDLQNNILKSISHFSSWVNDFVFDGQDSGVAFLTGYDYDNRNSGRLCYYRDGMDSAAIMVDSSNPGMEGSVVKNSVVFFSSNGSRLFFRIEDKGLLDQSKNSLKTGAEVRILGIQDINYDYSWRDGVFATIKVNGSHERVIRLQNDSGNGIDHPFDGDENFVVTEDDIVGNNQICKRYKILKSNLYLVSAKNGSRTLIKKHLRYYDLSFSPSGKYVIWFDQEQRQWNSYNVSENRVRIITENIKNPLYFENDYPDVPRTWSVAGWLEKDKGVMLYDCHDLWMVDPQGLTLPVNLTRYYGARNGITFRYLNFNSSSPVIGTRDTLLLSAFDQKTKQEGFFQLDMGKLGLRKLTMTSDMYFPVEGNVFCGGETNMLISKAKFSQKFILTKMNSTDYPNLYFTQNFSTFEPITKLAPQKAYNWYSSELIHWQLPGGKISDGILYKPENFNPRLKYPIIFYFYEKCASNLNLFIHPALSNGAMNIPWFVSNGFLVFVPDIYYQNGYPGRSACNSVVSAAQYLSKEPWTDIHRMGVHGHSFGGQETNYIITHSSLFAAAAPASGISNAIGSYGETGAPLYYENRQGRIGASLWTRPDLYIENSAVFRANKVSAAVLIMQTIGDAVVPYSNGIQWYNDLHYLGKKVWLLNYSNENHNLENENNQLDYSIRLGQFFDHFLKGALAPYWMTRGVPSSMKGKDDGLELDTNVLKP
jgi:dienelactone hydrolase